MKESWEQLCIGDVITVKRKDKFVCVFVSDIPGYPITLGDAIEVVDFFSNHIQTYQIEYDSYVNLDAPFSSAINYKIPVGSLVEIKVSKKEAKSRIGEDNMARCYLVH